tara:strand:+ start:860 stop:1009 length:150 start_codon:yes stop_codon:yes gene_type:complete
MSDITFLHEAAKYFRKLARETNEDKEFWSFNQNAENLDRIANEMENMRV